MDTHSFWSQLLSSDSVHKAVAARNTTVPPHHPEPVLDADGTPVGVTYGCGCGSSSIVFVPYAFVICDDGTTVTVRCPGCKHDHMHSASEGTRVPHCDGFPPGAQYYVRRCGSSEPLRVWGD